VNQQSDNSSNNPTPIDSTQHGGGASLGRRTSAGQPIRIATLSWSVPEDDIWGQSARQFTTSLEASAGDRGVCDLILCAGLPVQGSPTAKSILRSSRNTPVMFESASGAWLLAHVAGGAEILTALRGEQIVARYDDWDAFPEVVDVIADGCGVLSLGDGPLNLVLFICGENNLLQSATRVSVFKSPPSSQARSQELSQILGGPWIALNPAHSPYYPQNKMTGFAKVGVVGKAPNSAGPTLRHLAQASASYRDGTTSPAAVIHVNNFFKDVPKTQQVSTVAFGDKPRRLEVQESVASALVDKLCWQCSVVEVHV